jgi:hypothetical protein
MSVLLQVIATGAHIVLVADTIPQLRYEPSCRAAIAAAATPERNENACLQDEKAAKQKLAQEWGQFSPAQRAHCVRLSTSGGLPSYVELLTCVEMSKAAAELPKGSAGTPPVDRGTVGAAVKP